MNTVQLSDRLRTALTELMVVETNIQTTLSNSRKLVAPHPEACARVVEIEQLASDHIDAILARLRSADDREVNVPLSKPSTRSNRDWLSDLHPVSSALRSAYARLSEATIGYSMIQPIATRFRDSWVAGDDTTGHLARKHTQDYLAAAGWIMVMIHDVVVWELEGAGLECRCTCPACSIGVCVGAASSRSIVAQAQSAALPAETRSGVYVHQPRAGSATAEAGLQRGDLLLAINGTRIDSLTRLQTVVRDHKPGDRMKFRVQRDTDEINVDVIRHYDQHAERASDVDECIQPIGEEFSQARAQELHEKLRTGGGGNAADYSELAKLTAREIQILRLLAEGASNSMIAAELVISRATVARHVADILAKLQLSNRTEAATLATQTGLLSRA